MKKKSLFLIFSIVMTLSLSSCGSKSETSSTSEQQSEQSITIEPTETSDTMNSTSESVVYSSPTPTLTPSPTSTATPTPTVTPDPTSDPTESNTEDFLTDQMRQDLETLGATEDEINSIKTEKDMVDLINKLISNDRSSSTTNSNSWEKSEGNSESETDPWGDIPATGGIPDDQVLPGSM